MIQEIIIKSLNIDHLIFFKGTEEEAAAAEAKEAAAAEKIKAIITDPAFLAMEYLTEYKQRRILHHSTRNYAKYQLSYIDPDGVPAMHESYIKTGIKTEYSVEDEYKLYRHYINQCLEDDLILKVLKKED